MSESIKQIINPKDAKVDANHLRINGVLMRGEISPFDIPKEMIASYDESTKCFVCKLVYITDESLNKEFVASKDNANLFFYFGKTSGKLYKIEIENIEKNKIPSVTVEITLKIKDKIDSQSKAGSFESASSILNLMSAKKALESTQIFNNFATAT